MATWKGVITNAGSSILNEWVNEKTLNFDSAAAGQGTVPAQAMLAQTALVSQKQTASLLGGEEVDTGIRLKIRITAPDTAYTLNQYGVFASVDGGESVLIALFQIDAGIPIPSKTESPDFVYTFYALIMCSNTGTWTVTIDTSVCVTAEDMQKAIETAVASCESLLKNADVKNSITDSDSVAIVDSADSSKTKRVLWSTIKSTLEKVFTPNTRKINNKDLSKDLTLTGEDINVSKSDSTTIKTALSNKADLVDGEVPLSQLPQLHQDIGVYVDAVNGSDDNNGSLQTPFATIQAAVDSLPKNLGAYSVTIYLAPGEYQAGATIQGFYGGGKRYYQSITIQAKENEFPVINGYVFVVGSSCSVRLSNLKINGRIEGYASADVSFIGGFVDPSTADIGVGIRALEVGNLYLQAVSIDNATEAAVSVARGTAYIRDLRGSGNACAVSAGDTSFGGPALVLTTQISTEATTKYIKLYGGTIIENGVIV